MKEIVVDYLTSKSHLVDSTRMIHIRHLYGLMDWASARGQPYDLAFTIMTWLSTLKPNARQRAWSVLNEFFAWRILAGKARASPMVGIQRPPGEHRVFKPLSRADVRQIFDRLTEESRGANMQWSFAAIRLRAILILAVAHGLRTGEILGLNAVDWLRSEKRVIVRRKGGTVVVVPLGDEAAESLYSWWAMRESRRRPGETAVFVDWNSGKRLEAMALIRQFGRLADRAGVVTDRGGLHQFRHAMAGILLDQGKSLAEIAQYLGHQNLTSTNYYLRQHFGTKNTLGSDVLKSILDEPGKGEVDIIQLRPVKGV